MACDANGVLTLFNRATREFHGLSEDRVPAEHWAEHYHLFHADGVTPMATEDVPLYRALQGEHVQGVEMVIAPTNGSRRVVQASGRSLLDEHGARLGAVVSMHDITARQEADEAVRRARYQRLRNGSSHSPGAVGAHHRHRRAQRLGPGRGQAPIECGGL